MKKMKRLVAILLTMAMVLGMSLTAFADKIAVPSGSDKAEISVTGLPENATVKAYQIVDATYDKVGFVAFKEVVADSIADPTKPTAAEVSDIANKIALGKPIFTEEQTKTLAAQDDGSYAVEAEAGYWLIVVDPIGYKIFNPMLAGVYYENTDGTGNTIAGGTVDSTKPWNLTGTNVHAKQSETTIKKEIVDPSTGNEKGDDVAIGEDITFKVTSKIPAYSKDTYKTATFKVTDTLSAGISFLKNPAITVTVGGETVKAGEKTYSAVIDRQVLTVEFVSDYIFDNGGDDVVITYMAELNENAVLDNNSNDNKVELTYTTKPGEKITKDPKVTHHYSFDFDVIKVDDAKKELSGATFTLYEEDGKTVVATATSDENGKLHYTGLDVGTYKLQETVAPNGYQIDATVHTVVIDAKYDNATGLMESYSIKVDEKLIEELTEGAPNVKTDEVSFTNTKLVELPSTGGIGTTIFTIVGCLIMVAAVGMFFVSRRRENI